MINLLKQIPWRRLVLVGLGALMSYVLIPVIASRYNDIRLLGDARLTRAVDFGNRNDAFNIKVNSTATLLRLFSAHNYRMKLSGDELKEARKDLYKNYTERYLELNGMAWWWPSEYLREGTALQLLSPDELKRLADDVRAYNESVVATMNQVIFLWRFLDSPEYAVDEKSKQRIDSMEATMDKEFAAQHAIRNELAQKIGLLLTQSNFRASTIDLIGF